MPMYVCEKTDLHGEMIEEAFPTSWPLEKVVNPALNGQREVVLLTTVHSRVEEDWLSIEETVCWGDCVEETVVHSRVEEHGEVAVDGRVRLVGGDLDGLVSAGRRRRFDVARGRALGAGWRQVPLELDRR